MAFINYKTSNNAETTLLWDISASSTNIIVQSSEWDIFPSSFPYLLTLEKFNSSSQVIKREIVKVTWKTWDTFTISRAEESCVQDDTANPKTLTNNALSFSSWDKVSIYNTAWNDKDLKDELVRLETDKANDSEVIHNTWDETGISWNKTFTWNITANAFIWDWSGLTWISSVVKATQSTATAWEDISAWDALCYYPWVDSNLSVWIWSNTSNEKQSETFTLWTWVNNITQVKALLYKIGNPTDNVVVRIETDSWWDPSWTLVDANATWTIWASWINANCTPYTINFTWTFNLSAWTYHLVFDRSWALSLDRISLQISSTDVLAGRAVKRYSLGSWIADTSNRDIYATIIWDSDIDFVPINDWYYKTDASNSNKINFIWFANNTVTSWNTVTINTAWVDSNQSWLTTWSEYYLSDTAWAISTTPWTNAVKVWKAISATEILIDTEKNDLLEWATSTTATTWAVTLWNAVWYVTIKLNWSNVKIPYYNV